MVSQLGEGGMGEVFLAWDERLHRHVAIKRIRADRSDEHHRARFRREARAVARLSHPAIVQVFDVVETDEGDCIVMERVEGKTLVEFVRDEAPGPAAIAAIAADVADGLAEAHAKGLVHRDLKPENVMVTSSGQAKILDFGLARTLRNDDSNEETASLETLTRSGAVLGTLYAMSPEQAGGGDVDHRSDLFALGNLLYMALTGKAPFRGKNALDTLRRVTSVEPHPVATLRPDVPAALADLVTRLLAKDPGQRPQDAATVAAELRRIAAQDGNGRVLQAAVDLDHLPTAVGSEPSPSGTKTAVRTLVLTDLVDSTGLIEEIGDVRAADVFARHDRLARDLMAEHGGLEIDKSDGFLLLFERPLDAIGYTLAYHRMLAELKSETGCRLEARAAIHLGEVVLRRNLPTDVSRGAKPLEVEGLAKPMVARIASLAVGGQTLLSRNAFDLGRRAARDDESWDEDLRWLAHGPYVLQGVEDPLEIFEVGIAGRAPLLPPRNSDKVHRAATVTEDLVLGWRPAAGQPVPRRPNWNLVRRLGQGGFGEVWLATHKSGDERVFKFCFEAKRLRSLKREVTLFRLLKEALGNRDDIARIIDWSFEESPYFLETEHTDGGNLVDWVAAQGGFDAVPLETRLELVAQVADALAAAHSVGILHKDVKPENVLVRTDREGRPRIRVTDFGIGLLTDETQLLGKAFTIQGMTEATTDDSVVGTHLYMAPEALVGRPASVQADVYSLGVMLFQMVTGDFSRAVAPGWERDVEDDLLREDLAQMVDGAPERRPGNAQDVARRLRDLEERRQRREAKRREREERKAERQALAKAQRRRKTLTAVLTAAVLVLAVISALAVKAFFLARAADEASQRAALRRERAEKLVHFMLGDLKVKLGEIGRLDVLDGVGSEVLAYFESLPPGELSATELQSGVEALRLIGNGHFKRGDLEAASAAFKESRRLASDLVHRDPENMKWSQTLGEACFWVGYTDWRRGDLDAALSQFQTFLQIAKKASASDPKNLDWQHDVLYATNNIAHVWEEKGDLDAALKGYSECLDIADFILQQDPGNEDAQESVARAHNTLGKVLRTRGLMDEALQHHMMELEIKQALAKDNPTARRQRSLALTHNYIGTILNARGDHTGALESFRNAVRLFEQLLAVDATVVQWQRGLALNQMSIGDTLLRLGRPREAIDVLRHSADVLAGLPENSSAATKEGEGFARFYLGRALLAVDNPEVEHQVQKLAEIADTLRRQFSDETAALQHEGNSWLLRGEFLKHQKRSSSALDAFRRALDLIVKASKETDDYRLLESWAQVLSHLGNKDEAANIVHQLGQKGHREITLTTSN